MEKAMAEKKKVMFGAGCFWGVEHTFATVPGLVSTAVGYAQGSKDHPTYQEVCSGQTGHTEVVALEFDPDKVSLEKLLDVFWQLHDPSQLNRQGPDVGTQYRSGIYVYEAGDDEIARASLEKEEKSGRHNGKIMTEIQLARTFWRAEDYHQKYIEKQGQKRRFF
jgi:peptide-methionine (S)-S-oxide reductase